MAQGKIRLMVGRMSGLSSHPAYTAPQATAATFKHGAPVKLASGLLAAVSTANGGSSSNITFVKKSSTNNILGISQGLAKASSDNSIVVSRIAEGMEFQGNLIHATASSAKVSKVGSTVYLAKANSASDIHWGWSLTGHASSAASYVQGQITGLVDPASTVNGRVLAQITNGGALIT